MEMTTTRYEHRVIKEHNAGLVHYDDNDYIFKIGMVLAKTKTPNKRRYYDVVFGHGMGATIPKENVGVFKITRTVIETEEML